MLRNLEAPANLRSKLRSREQNQQFRPEFSVLTLRLKRSSTVSSKALKTILACSLHLHLIMLHWLDLKNIFIWLGFSHFFEMLSFLDFFFYYETGDYGKCVCPPRGMESSICTCSLKFPEFWKVQVHATWHVHWSSVPPTGTFRLKRKKNNQRKYPKENQDIGFEVKIQRGITLQILNEIMRFWGICSLEYK